MAYGLICTSALLASGAPPAVASASVHAAEVVTTGLAGGSHPWHRNVDWRLVRRLAPAGVAGGALRRQGERPPRARRECEERACCGAPGPRPARRRGDR